MPDVRDPEPTALPLSLRVIAYVSILLGVGSVIDSVVSLFRDSLSINIVGVLQIPAGFGLLRLSYGWRTFKLLILWLAFILIGYLAISFALGKTLNYPRLPEPWHRHEKEIGLLIDVVLLAYLIWEYRVLTSPRVRQLFGVK
jgi:hypothetical protein